MAAYGQRDENPNSGSFLGFAAPDALHLTGRLQSPGLEVASPVWGEIFVEQPMKTIQAL
jgi:hypothetical protein